MTEYKRLTNKDWKENYDIFSDVCCDTCTEDCGKCERSFNALVRLAELEDKIENGTLVGFPRIIHPNTIEWLVQYQYESGMIGCDIFYSEAEAEARLKELQE